MRIAILNWRDLTHPDGGGAERYAVNVATGLVQRGHEVTLMCADHGRAPRDEMVDGVRLRRRGGRVGVYLQALRGVRFLERTEGPFDVVVDVQNGLPFFAPLATRTPVVSLVHHVHKEQWPVVFNPISAKIGWGIESWLSPKVYRGRQYVAVSGRTKDELAELGVEPSHIAVIHNGTDEPMSTNVGRSTHPTIVVLGRLVPHKRVEHAIDVLARLRESHPGLRLRIIGDGWWAPKVREHAEACDVSDSVTQLGFISEQDKHTELAQSWVAIAPSIKEGWGLNVVEAASHGVPTVAYHGAGGLSESIEDGRTGLLVHDLDAMVAAVSRLLSDQVLRDTLGVEAREHARQFTWEGTIKSWEDLLQHVALHDAPMSATDAGAILSPRS
ncbi:MAG: glycosyltransferase family 4 protein [Phycicoccus sp.]|nr:glycosyltransferase family 4 protein [Phycicoccus sp.]